MIVIAFVVVLTPVVTNPTGLTINLLLKSLYVSVTIPVFWGLTLTKILWGELKPWVPAVETVTKFLLMSPVITL